MDMTIIQPNLVDGAVPIICRIPSYSMPQWLVQIDDQTIRVVKQVKKRERDIFIE
jgi:hypothetical protein